MTVRDEITAIQRLGVMPDSDATLEVVEAWGTATDAIKTPVTDEEALILLAAMPHTDDTLYGLAFALLHAIETAPGYGRDLVMSSAVMGEWKETLLDRLERCDPQQKGGEV